LASQLFIIGRLAAPQSPLAILLGCLRPVDALAHPALHAIGLVAVELGLILTIEAQLTMGSSWRIGVDPGERTALVTGGVFTHVRNPIYTRLLLALVGRLLLARSFLAYVALVSTAIGLEVQVRGVEEPYLLRIPREHYRAYARRTGRVLPRLGRGE
jgi:protein-S-isoprenylcysteine O-methyltransferase Ste14